MGLICAQILILLIPVALVRIPPLMDYPNHLTRYWLLSGEIDQLPLSSMYGIDFNLLTNIGLDLAAKWLGPIVSTPWLGSAFIALAIVLPFVGMAALNYMLFRRLDWWLLTPTLLLWNQSLLAGFLNFNVGLGLALLATACDRWISPRRPLWGFLFRGVAAALLGIIHLFALAFFVALLFGVALGEGVAWRKLFAAAKRICLAVFPALLALIILVAASPSLPGAHSGADASSVLSDVLRGLANVVSREKFKGAIVSIVTYHPVLDLMMPAVTLALVIIAASQKRLRVHAGLLVVSFGLLILFILAPMDLAGTGWIDRRFALMSPMAMLVSLHPDFDRRFSRSLFAVFFLASGLRTADVTRLWLNFDRDVDALQATLSTAPPGSRIMPVMHEPVSSLHRPGRYIGLGDPAFWHLPVLAIMWRKAFVPTLFTARGKQPIFVRPPFDAIAVPEGPLASVHVLIDPERDNGHMTSYVDQWRDKFDFVLVVNADLPDRFGPFMPPANLVKVYDSGFAQLYRIMRSQL